MKRPTIVIIDGKKILDTYEFEIPDQEHVPESKIGFSGVQLHKGVLYVTTWDRICMIDPASMKIMDSIQHPHFSDLHGLFVDDSGVLVANTNLDAVYKYDQSGVSCYWSSSRKKDTPITDQNYSNLTKDSIENYEEFHINGVYSTENMVFVCYLGTSYKGRWIKTKIIRALNGNRVRNGGVFVLDKYSSKVIKNIRSEGLHDPILHGDELFFPEYFGTSLLVVNRKTLKKRKIRLSTERYDQSGYLNRGGFFAEDQLFIGKTIHNDYRKQGIYARLHTFDLDGNDLGNSIELPGCNGIYHAAILR